MVTCTPRKILAGGQYLLETHRQRSSVSLAGGNEKQRTFVTCHNLQLFFKARRAHL